MAREAGLQAMHDLDVSRVVLNDWLCGFNGDI